MLDFEGLMNFELFQRVRTGNPFFDAILFGLISMFFSRFFGSGGILQMMITRLFLPASEPESVTYILNNHMQANQYVNEMFNALEWFMAKQCRTGDSSLYHVVSISTMVLHSHQYTQETTFNLVPRPRYW